MGGKPNQTKQGEPVQERHWSFLLRQPSQAGYGEVIFGNLRTVNSVSPDV
jgi:hypothetical protein